MDQATFDRFNLATHKILAAAQATHQQQVLAPETNPFKFQKQPLSAFQEGSLATTLSFTPESRDSTQLSRQATLCKEASNPHNFAQVNQQVPTNKNKSEENRLKHFNAIWSVIGAQSAPEGLSQADTASSTQSRHMSPVLGPSDPQALPNKALPLYQPPTTQMVCETAESKDFGSNQVKKRKPLLLKSLVSQPHTLTVQTKTITAQIDPSSLITATHTTTQNLPSQVTQKRISTKKLHEIAEEIVGSIKSNLSEYPSSQCGMRTLKGSFSSSHSNILSSNKMGGANGQHQPSWQPTTQATPAFASLGFLKPGAIFEPNRAKAFSLVVPENAQMLVVHSDEKRRGGAEQPSEGGTSSPKSHASNKKQASIRSLLTEEQDFVDLEKMIQSDMADLKDDCVPEFEEEVINPEQWPIFGNRGIWNETNAAQNNGQTTVRNLYQAAATFDKPMAL